MSIVVFGGSFNPPGIYHRQVAKVLSAEFDEVVVVPCGPRPDKPTTNAVAPVFRAAMTDMAFRGIPKVRVDLFDLEQATFTRTHLFRDRFPGRKVWHAVGASLVSGGKSGESTIQTGWDKGEWLWENARFVVFHEPGDAPDPEDLPVRSRVVEVATTGRSAEIRQKLFHGEPAAHLMPPEVADYIERHGLYRLSEPSRTTRVRLEGPRLLIVADERNPKARGWLGRFRRFGCPEDPNCVLVLGGDGTMLSAIQRHWRLRIPFFGVNAGHLGFLLNDAADLVAGGFPPPEVVVREMPMLYIEAQSADGTWTEHLTFNDAWLERSTGQSAWLEVDVDGRTRFSKLVCDGVLVSTAAGSTAYASSMGATPLLADTPAWLVVGSNVMYPHGWKSALLSTDSRVEIRTLATEKRPTRGYIHGVALEEVVALRARISRSASVALAFCPEHDMAEKIARIQFPG